MLEQRLLQVAAEQHPDSTFKVAAMQALKEINDEKIAGTYGVTKVSAATSEDAQRTRTTQEPCTEEELCEMLPKSGD